MPVSEAHLVSKYVGAGKANPPLHTLGGTRWHKAKEQTEKAVRDIAAVHRDGERLTVQLRTRPERLEVSRSFAARFRQM